MIKSIIIFIISILLIRESFSQVNSIREPVSFRYKSLTNPLTQDNNIWYHTTSVINTDSALRFEKELNKDGKPRPELYGVEFNVDFTTTNSGTWDTLENGDRMWRVKIACPYAYTINLLFSSYEVPDGAFIFIYNSSKSFIRGPFYNRFEGNNTILTRRKKKLSTHLFPGESLFIEYYEPKDAENENNIHLSKIIYGYKDLFRFKRNENKINKESILSGSCNRDVNCTEGDDFCREKYSVAILLAPNYDPYWGYCSGSLINNTRNDFTPYFLTAFHCVDYNQNGVLSQVEISDLDSWSFRFGYMREGCETGNTLTTFDYEAGAELSAAWFTSDFALLQLNDQPISGQADNFPDVFFNGWDRTGDIPNSVVGIHHPAGDMMKISVSNESPDIIDNDTHWDVDWTTGTTEGGSSGSPLYNPIRYVIGQVHYGIYPPNISDPCHPDKRTAYGMLSASWNGGGTAATRLRDWLDPNNTGVDVLDGIHLPSNIYGHVYSSGSQNLNAYDQMNIGSGIHNSTTIPFRVESGVTMNLKAGREIVLRPCSQILYGSDFHAYIEQIDCADNIIHSERDDIYDDGCGSYSPKEIDQDFPFENKLNAQFINLLIFPNPVTGIANFKYSIASESISRMDLRNIYGELIISLMNNVNQKIGTYSLEFDASGLPSGIYLLTLNNGEQVISKQFVILK